MDNVLSYLTFNTRQFHEMSMRARVLLSLAPLPITVALMAIATIFLHPVVWERAAYQWGMILTAAILLFTAVIPWDKLPYGLFLIVPVASFIPIGLLRFGADIEVLGVGLLAVFPVLWLCASGLHPRFALAVSLLGPLAIIWVPVFLQDAEVNPSQLTQSALLPVIIFTIGVTIRVMTASMMDQQRAMEEKDHSLQQLLQRSARNERLLNATVNTVDVGLLAIDADGHDILFNRRQREIHRIGMPPGREDAPEKDLLLFRADGITPIPEDQRPAIRAVRGETYSDNLIRIGTGENQRVLSASARVMLDESGKREGAVVAFNDVTTLVNALNAKEEFVAMVSHELRTPLTVIVGYLEIMLDDDLPPETKTGLTVISRNVARLRRLVDDLLAAASGAPEVSPVTADLGATVAESVAVMHTRGREAGVEIVSEVPEGMTARFDPARMGQVFDNLLSNAIKYSPSGGTVTIRAQRMPGSVVCEVEDQGMGMSPEDSAEVFSKFFRTSAVRQAAIPGVGLGLAIVRSIIEEHGGRIHCRSELGRGTTFIFELPDIPGVEPGAAG
ncbi:PAS domain-containing sensor histidine kinase [Arthrobacter sp. JZ12]|uniref:sensor histidine kinase n=1 Tax=Arthrobacter sp. JZ12 TaxID=2654190 RepID=UPI002B4A86DD|nr:ATP-binding protein [Arthrobacter sp. JZ12]WRH25685.1 PAS domain-containing sensor histidine kinase [Arthrobacter sp. JZ12]